MAIRKKEESEELKEYLGVEKELTETEEVAVVFDGKQYSIRIPKRFAKRMGIDVKADRFKFTITVPPVSEGNPEMSGEFVRG